MVQLNTTEISSTNVIAKIQLDVRNFIIENFMFGQGGETLVDSASLLDEGILDSTGLMEIGLFVSQEYGFGVEGEELLPENFDSVDNLTRYIARKMELLQA